jgi:ribosomal protein L4
VEVKVTNFEREDKGIAILAGDIFDVPIRSDIVHRVVRWQLAKRREVRTTARLTGLPFAHLKGLFL